MVSTVKAIKLSFCTFRLSFYYFTIFWFVQDLAFYLTDDSMLSWRVLGRSAEACGGDCTQRSVRHCTGPVIIHQLTSPMAMRRCALKWMSKSAAKSISWLLMGPLRSQDTTQRAKNKLKRNLKRWPLILSFIAINLHLQHLIIIDNRVDSCAVYGVGRLIEVTAHWEVIKPGPALR